MSPQAPGICHCEERSDPRVEPVGMRGNLRPVGPRMEIATSHALLAMTVSSRGGGRRPVSN
jgi:hypothetical protein